MSTIRVECVRNVAALESLSDDFNRLSAGATMQRLSWLIPWWEAYQANHKLHVLVGFRGESVCGFFPLVETTSALTGRSLVFMGSGKACSDDLGILVQDVDSEEVVTAFATWLVQSPDCCPWDHLDLDGIREDNQVMAHFRRSLESLSGSHFESKSSPNCWATSLCGGLDAYKGRLTKRARKIISRAESAMDSGRGRFEIATTLEQAMEFACEIERMHQARWKERGIDGCFTTIEFSRFLTGAINRMWVDSWEPSHQNVPTALSQRVCVGLLRIDETVAAGAVCFRDRDAMALYLVGMNPEFAEDHPGWMLNTCFIKYAIELGCARYDFLRGDEEYKERLGGVVAAQNHWIVPSSRFTSQVRNVAYRTAVGVKQWWNHKSLTLPSQRAST